MSSPRPSARRWYRSLYWRIALGFIAFLAATLGAQGALFVWLSTQRGEALPPRLLGDLAALVAGELGDAADRAPGADLGALAAERFRELDRPAALVLPDGRVVAEAPGPPPALVEVTLRRLQRGSAAWRERLPREGRGRDWGPPADVDDDVRPGGAPWRPGLPPWAVAPVRRSGGQVVGAVLVARSRPTGAVVRELAPWLAIGFAGLLAAGTALAAVAIFRPAHTRLRDLEDAARRFAAGDRTARAPDTGGDEVTAVARAFNRMADQAAAREAALVEADRARRQLLADVTHELRTPLTAIRGYAETLSLPAFAPSSPDGQRFVRIVDAEAQRLERLVHDLLDLARLDAGGVSLERDTVSLPALFARVVERHAPAAAVAGVSLAIMDAPGAEAVTGDARRLEQVLQNLTANALRHTPRGGRVTLEAGRAGRDVEIRVSDTGEGIAAEHLPHVFDRFYKVDPARADAGGTGLGLSIVKAIVERHGGSVAVESTPGVRTTFTVRLPA